MSPVDYEKDYRTHVAELERRLSADEALSRAVGGEFVAVGKLEHYLLRSLGLRDDHRVVDVGCGSGRLACQLAPFPKIDYLGCDVVPRLLEYAKDLCRREDWRFELCQGATIPAEAESADFACFFSVFTHLAHEDTYRYILEAHRVLKPGGLLVMSFLEFCVPSHWVEFISGVAQVRPDRHLNQFLSRDAIEAWSHHAHFAVRHVHRGDTMYIPLPETVSFENGMVMTGNGSLGQSVAVLQKAPAAAS
ncbi:MAG: methyltransferase domain-containing protein [Opitutaceae bacterium]|nr:methyltransferase domain-containing protein [Opitutaceae bacterium]